MKPIVPRQSLFQSLRLSIKDATFYSFMVGSGEAYLAAYVLALGFSATSAGLITTVPVVVGATIQFMFLWAYKYLRSYRKWVLFCARGQAVVLLGMATLAQWAPHQLAPVYVMASLYWICSFSAGPAWNAWMGALVPPRLRVQFFSQRTRRAQMFTYIGIFVSGVALYWAKRVDWVLPCFSSLLALAGVSRLMSAHFISRQIETPREKIRDLMNQSPGQPFWQRMRDPKLVVMLFYLFGLQLSVYVAAPFFSPYMLKELQLDYASYMFLTSTTFLARILFYPFIQKFADRYGPLKMVWIGTMLIVCTPYLWTLSQNYAYLMALQVLSGSAWGMQELGIFLLLLDRFPTQERSGVLTVVNFLNSVGMLLGSLIGSRILNQFGVAKETYYFIFGISSFGRLMAGVALPYLHDVPKSRRFAILWRIVGLRPNLGAIMRPILYVTKKSSGVDSDSQKRQ